MATVRVITRLLVVIVICGASQPTDDRRPRRRPSNQVQISNSETVCTYPCRCDESVRCRRGVSIIKDGCGCCNMCARQQGDMCNNRDTCDRRLRCHGDVCRAKSARRCVVGGQAYKDGQQFHLNCSRLCSCHDGRHICTDTCRHQAVTPSTAHCTQPQLVSVRGRCCREWVCPHVYNLVPAPAAEGGQSSALVTSVKASSAHCRLSPTEWSRCSVSCAVGVSSRVTYDDQCRPTQQTRICMIRNCGEQRGATRRCRHSRRLIEPTHFRYGRCRSVRDFRPKLCGTCAHDDHCCMPHATKTLRVQFTCDDDTIVWRNVMWTKSCRCEEKQCS